LKVLAETLPTDFGGPGGESWMVTRIQYI
jgi:hypothetical protein